MSKGNNKLDHISFGQLGSTYIGQQGTPVLPKAGHVFTSIQVITACKFTALVGAVYGDNKYMNTVDVGDSAAGTQLVNTVEFPAGTILYGRWSSINLAAGTVIAYSAH